MTTFSVTDVAFSGIRFVRERPRTVAIWAGFQILISLVLGGVTVALMGPYLAQLSSFSRQRPADPTQVMAVFSHLLPLYAVVLPLSLIIGGVVYAAVDRSVLRPADDGMAYIRFGADEARQMLLMLLWVLFFIGADIVISIVMIIPMMILALVFRGAPTVGLLVFPLVFAALIFLTVRLSLSSALTFDKKRVDLFGSWALTKGQFWNILWAYLLVVVLACVILVLVSIIAGAVAAVLGGVGGLTAMFSGNVASIGDYFAPARLAVTVIWALATPLFWALFLRPPVEIYRHLSGSADPALDPSTFD